VKASNGFKGIIILGIIAALGAIAAIVWYLSKRTYRKHQENQLELEN
jgi:type II secretory pathway pseudopilin PulG